jgi:hypothetical protein
VICVPGRAKEDNVVRVELDVAVILAAFPEILPVTCDPGREREDRVVSVELDVAVMLLAVPVVFWVKDVCQLRVPLPLFCSREDVPPCAAGQVIAYDVVVAEAACVIAPDVEPLRAMPLIMLTPEEDQVSCALAAPNPVLRVLFCQLMESTLLLSSKKLEDQLIEVTPLVLDALPPLTLIAPGPDPVGAIMLEAYIPNHPSVEDPKLRVKFAFGTIL